MKACIAKQTARHDFPELKKVNDSFVHDLKKLVCVANLKSEVDAESSSNQRFASRWTAVFNWNEKSRYNLYQKSDADEIITAITAKSEGVLPWIKRRW